MTSLEMIKNLQSELTRQAMLIAEDFMKNRSNQANKDNWSDLTVRVRETELSLAIEWNRREWKSQAVGGKRRFNSKYVRESSVLRYARSWEVSEVRRVRDQLKQLKETYKLLQSIRKAHGLLGLLGSDADMLVGFVSSDVAAKRKGTVGDSGDDDL